MDGRDYRSKTFGSWEYSQRVDEQGRAAGALEELEFNYERVNRTLSPSEAVALSDITKVHAPKVLNIVNEPSRGRPQLTARLF